MSQFQELGWYCQETFDLVVKNPFLFVPRLIFFGAITVLMVLVMGTAWLARPLTGFPMILGILVVLGLAVASILLEAGQLNLLRAAVQGEPVDQETFREGIPLYTGLVAGLGMVAIVFAILSTLVTVYLDQLLLVIYDRRS